MEKTFNLDELIADILDVYISKDHGTSSICKAKLRFQKLSKYLAERNTAYYSKDIGEQYLNDVCNYSYSIENHLDLTTSQIKESRCIREINEFIDTGTLAFKHFSGKCSYADKLNSYYHDALSKYTIEHLFKIRRLRPKTIKNTESNLAQFFFYLQQTSVKSLLDVDVSILNSYFNKISPRYENRTLNIISGKIYNFYRYLSRYYPRLIPFVVFLESYKFSVGFNEAHQDYVFTIDELNRVADSYPINDEKDVRNLAIILLLIDTANRPVDIINLKFKNLKGNELSIIQHKTSRYKNTDYLHKQTMRVIDEYVQKYRPHKLLEDEITDEDYIFLRSYACYEKLVSYECILKDFKRAVEIAGIEIPDNYSVTLRGIRKSIATILGADINVSSTTIQAKLGHTDQQSIGYYLTPERLNLRRKCILPVSNLPPIDLTDKFKALKKYCNDFYRQQRCSL